MRKTINRALNALSTSVNLLSLWQLLFGASGILGSVALSSYIVKSTTYLSQYGNAAIFGATLVTLCALSFIIFMLASASLKQSEKKINDARSIMPTGINLLEEQFDKKIIKTDDLWSFSRQKVSGKRFHNCRFSGPMVILFMDGTLKDSTFTDCTMVEVGDSYIKGVIAFDDCIFTSCEFDSATVFIHEDMRPSMERGINGDIPFVNVPSRFKEI